MNSVLLVVPALFFSDALAAEQCEVVEKYNLVSVFVYCPPKMKIEDVSIILEKFSDLHMDLKERQVHIYVFNDKKTMPNNPKQLMNKSEKWLDKHYTAQYSVNKSSNYFSYMCRKNGSGKFVDCKSLLK